MQSTYEQKWLSHLPVGWTSVPLSSLVHERKNKNSGMLVTNLLSLSYGQIIHKDISAAEGLLPESFEGYNIIEKGDVVLRLTDLQNDQHSLRVGLVKERGIITSAYVTLQPKSNLICPDFLYYSLHAFDLAKGFYGLGAGVRQGLNYEGLKRISIPLPAPKTQIMISDFLNNKCSEIDSLIAVEQAQIRNLEDYRKSIVLSLVTKGIRPCNHFKDSGAFWMGEIPSHWDVCKQKFKLKLINGRAFKDTEFETNGKYKILRVGNLFSNPEWYTSSLELEEDKYCEDGDLLYAWSMSYGPYIWHGDKTIYHYHIWKVNLAEGMNREYCYYYLLALSDSIKSQSHETTMGFVTMGVMNASLIPVPPVEEQIEIARFLDTKMRQIDELEKVKYKKIELLSSYKKALIYERVTGKKEVA